MSKVKSTSQNLKLQLNLHLASPVQIFPMKGEGILRENLGAPLE